MRTAINIFSILLALLLALAGIGLVGVSIGYMIHGFRWVFLLGPLAGIVLTRFAMGIPFLYDNYLIKKETGRLRKMEQDLKSNGPLIRVPAGEIAITGDVQENVIEGARTFPDWLGGFLRGVDRSGDVRDYDLLSVLSYTTRINGREYDFVSLPVRRRQESIMFRISERGFVDLYIDSSNPENYFFDVKFLQPE